MTEMNFVYCPTCKKSDVLGKFCYICGATLITKTYSPPICECGGELYEKDNYCRNCGRKVENEPVKNKEM